MSADELVKLLLGQVGVVSILLAALALGHKKFWVWGYQLKEEQDRVAEQRKESDEWRDRFLVAMAQSSQATSVASKVVSKLKGDE